MISSSMSLADLQGQWRPTSFLLDPDSLVPSAIRAAGFDPIAPTGAVGALYRFMRTVRSVVLSGQL